ncbi:hypothetical protein O6H91_10G048400 [Diphasiastrum complanatum]|uniref:Uncharacterized protein n=1 Tax=Diphasiastrum complanatum TaxID=34168 RepID=A0ACC2CHM5_DIPCM|nr:hypothetical protein O6H91_10G048400 [Diphasiastrum complanatum]
MTAPKPPPSYPLKRRNMTVSYDISSTLSPGYFSALQVHKKLKRMPHLFPRVLELPCAADAPVEVYENEDCFTFSMRQTGLISEEIKAEVIEIVPGAVKVAVGGIEELLQELVEREAIFWRFRLPASTIPEASTALYEDEILTVTVPKVSSTETKDPSNENDTVVANFTHDEGGVIEQQQQEGRVCESKEDIQIGAPVRNQSDNEVNSKDEPRLTIVKLQALKIEEKCERCRHGDTCKDRARLSNGACFICRLL